MRLGFNGDTALTSFPVCVEVDGPCALDILRRYRDARKVAPARATRTYPILRPLAPSQHDVPPLYRIWMRQASPHSRSSTTPKYCAR